FAAFPLLDAAAGRDHLARYYQPYLHLAAARGVGFVLETPTWRANRDWGAVVGYDEAELARVNRDAVAFVTELAGGAPEVLVSGCVGPRADSYRAGTPMSAPEATDYHHAQVEELASSGAAVATAFTLTYAAEAAGFATAAAQAGIASVVGFTLET